MERSNSPVTTSTGQTRKRKGRNSDIRKEQNRIASRAYREKRRQKLALLDEILKSDIHTDSMSSVSDETEYNSPAPAPEFRVMESTSRTRHSSNSPAPYYMSAIPALAPVSAGIQPVPSNGPNRDTEAYVSYSVKDYGQEAERLATHSGYASDPNVSSIGISSGCVSPLPPTTSMPSTPMFPFDDDFLGESFGTYPLPDGSMSSFPAVPGYDSNMMNALQCLSRLDDSQQQQLVAYIQKRRNVVQPTTADHPFHLGYGGYHVPVPRSSPGSGHLQVSDDLIQQGKGVSARYGPKPHR
ncbi:hypothetical protein NUW58_g2125 [Xylaria curta]|uniref:Uncharacterized protein n=1 Tax=Xylaria curta TaxID=42375 RepID=A0ACC1PJM2_9PEZI|nr:hypothetical protein NUW58_g2125 [Xylaria curta]